MKRLIAALTVLWLSATAYAQIGPGPSMVPLPVVAGCQPNAISLGSTSNTAGSTLVLSTSGLVPGGSTIVVGTGEGNNTTFGAGSALVDDAGNTYTRLSSVGNGGITGVGFGSFWYVVNAAQLNSGLNITYTKHTAFTSATAMTALYIPCGPMALDGTITNTASAFSSTAAVSFGTPPSTNPRALLVGLVSWQNSSAATCSTNTYNTPPFATVVTGPATQPAGLCGGTLPYQNTGFSVGLSASNRWAAWIVGFK